MTTAGIICEFNPFHDGHKYLIESVRRDLCPDAVICIMSGNYTQRGEAALWDKWERAEAAVKGGADLVLQMPVCVSISSAPYFAKGAVDIAAALKTDYLCFGTESGDLEYIRKLAEEGIEGIEEGNNILACEYLRSMPKDMFPYTIKIDESLGHASDIRNNYVNNLKDKVFELLKYKILMSDAEILKTAPEVSEGLENRIIAMLPRAKDLDDFILSIKSKRYNYSRISRALLQILLGIGSSIPKKLYAHVLAFNETGQKLLAGYRNSEEICIYSNITPDDAVNCEDLALDIRADDVYSVLREKTIYDFSDYICKPLKTNI